MRFRKKPVEIEAIEASAAISAAEHAWNDLPEWLRLAYEHGGILFLSDAVEIATLEGTMRADRNDWIIQGVAGEIYPCKPDIFAQTYEPVN